MRQSRRSGNSDEKGRGRTPPLLKVLKLLNRIRRHRGWGGPGVLTHRSDPASNMADPMNDADDEPTTEHDAPFPQLPPRPGGHDPQMAALITFRHNDKILEEYGSYINGFGEDFWPGLDSDDRARLEQRMENIENVFSHYLTTLLAGGLLFARGFRVGELEPVQPSCEWWENARPGPSIRGGEAEWNGVKLVGLRLFQSPLPEKQSATPAEISNQRVRPTFNAVKARVFLTAQKVSRTWVGPPSEQDSRAFLLDFFSGVPNDPHRKIRHEVWPG